MIMTNIQPSYIVIQRITRLPNNVKRTHNNQYTVYEINKHGHLNFLFHVGYSGQVVEHLVQQLSLRGIPYDWATRLANEIVNIRNLVCEKHTTTKY